MASRRRATRVAAAAPNSRIIGGAGTGVPPVELEVDTLPELDADEAELVLDAELVLALVLDEVEVLVAPKLLEEMVPLDVEVELPPVDEEVELPPVEVEVDPPEVDVDPPEVDVEPAEVETVMVVLPPVELPPTKLPLKKPPPKPKPGKPPPMTTGTAPPPLLTTATGGGGGGGTNIGGTMVRVVVT